MALTKLRVRVGSNWYNVEVGDLSNSPVEVTVEGETYFVEIERPSALARSRPRRGSPETLSNVTPQPTTRTGAPGASDTIIRSPMPGRVISILVRPGERVSDGQEVCVVEAMKMEQSIRAPRAGVVKEVFVQPTDSVRTNDPLVELEYPSSD